MTRVILTLLCGASFASLSACASLPNRPPASDVATQTAVLPLAWSDRLTQDRASVEGVTAQSLWAGFADPELTALIKATLSNAPDIRAARARVAEAEATLRLTDSARRPTLSVFSSAARERTSGEGAFGNIPGISLEQSAYTIGGRAAWEPDVWGRLALDTESAAYQRVAAEAQVAAVSLSLQNQTARLYVQLRTAQSQKRVLQENAALLKRTLELTGQLVEQSLAPEFDRIQARARQSALDVQLEAVDAQIITLSFAVATLAGRAPAQGEGLIENPQPIPSYTGGIPAGVPSDLLLRRPDILAARAQVMSAQARSEAAELNALPSFSLTGEGGLLSITLEDLISTNARRGVISAALNWPIFQGGRLQAERDVTRARQSQTEAAYDGVILQSLNDVETAFAAYVSAKRRLSKLKVLEADLKSVLALTEMRYRSDLESQFQVLTAQSDVLVNNRDIETARSDIALSLIEINAALGGYWSP